LDENIKTEVVKVLKNREITSEVRLGHGHHTQPELHENAFSRGEINSKSLRNPSDTICQYGGFSDDFVGSIAADCEIY
jgi:hypothetical protein